MFVTFPEFQQPVPEGLKIQGLQHWAATVLSTQMPWYLTTYKLSSNRRHHLQTATISSEYFLRHWIKSVGRESVQSVNFVACAAGTDEWSMRRVEAMWTPAAGESGDTGPLVFRLSGESALWCSNDRPVTPGRRARRLLIRF